MPTGETPLVRDVSDTAYWIASHRARETARPDALFKDPLAARLAGEHGDRIAHGMPRPHMTAWVVVVRTCIIDDFIREAIAGGEIDAVLNLGAGLDTRPYRMTLPPELPWIEADFPGIIDYKARVLAAETPRCRLERVSVDLADESARREFLAGIANRFERVLVLTEGVVPYLDETQAGALAQDLRAEAAFRYWIVDYIAVGLQKYRKMSRRMPNSPFRFAPADWSAFFGERGWRPKAARYFAEESVRLGRPAPFALPMRLWIRLMRLTLSREKFQAKSRFAGYVMLEAAPLTF